MERWKPIDEYPHYAVSDEGRIKNSITGRVLKQGRHRQGYSLVWLSDSGERHGCSVHRLVAKAFVPNPDDKPQINHIDGDKSNNHYTNLEWNTGSENTSHAYRTGLFDGVPKTPVRIVETGEIFNSIRECANAINGDPSRVCGCMRGRGHTHRGLHFESI